MLWFQRPSSPNATWKTCSSKGCEEDFHHHNSPHSALVQTYMTFSRLKSYTNLHQIRKCIPVSKETQLFKVQMIMDLPQHTSWSISKFGTGHLKGQPTQHVWNTHKAGEKRTLKGDFLEQEWVSIWKQHAWDHTGWNTMEVWALPLSQITWNNLEQEVLSLLIHRTQVRRTMQKFPVQEKQPRVWSPLPCCETAF